MFKCFSLLKIYHHKFQGCLSECLNSDIVKNPDNKAMNDMINESITSVCLNTQNTEGMTLQYNTVHCNISPKKKTKNDRRMLLNNGHTRKT